MPRWGDPARRSEPRDPELPSVAVGQSGRMPQGFQPPGWLLAGGQTQDWLRTELFEQRVVFVTGHLDSMLAVRVAAEREVREDLERIKSIAERWDAWKASVDDGRPRAH